MYRLRTATTEPSDILLAWWAAWAVFLIGGLLTVATIWLTLSNSGPAIVPGVFFLWTAFGTILMALGALGVRVCEEFGNKIGVDRESVKADLRTFVAVGVFLGAGVGAALGASLGSAALGLATGPLVGLVLGMAVLLRVRRARPIAR